nr:acyl-coenzyme A thioesterase THEM4-like [Lytechinus pictus]
MTSNLLSINFLRQLIRHEQRLNQTSSFHKTLSRTLRTTCSTGRRASSRPTNVLKVAGVCLTGSAAALWVTTNGKGVTRMFSSLCDRNNFSPLQLVLKRSLCAPGNPKGTPERDLPGWTPRTKELYEDYQRQLLRDSTGWKEMLNSVDRERNKRLYTLNHPEYGATFEYVMFSNEEQKKSIAVVQFGEKVQGPPGYVHGGAIATIGDACAGVLIHEGLSMKTCVTANLSVNYKKPLPLNSTIIIETVVDKIDGRKCFTSSIFKSPDGSIIYDTVTTVFVDVSYYSKKESAAKS